MIPGAGRAWGLVAWLWGPWVIAALSAPSHAQTAPQAPPVPAPTYQDRYIAGGTLSPDISTGGYGTSETSGLARSIRIDGVVSVLDQEGADASPRAHENGVIVDAQWDTASYGAWSADAAVRTGGFPPPRGRPDHRTAPFSPHPRGLALRHSSRAGKATRGIKSTPPNPPPAPTRLFLGPGAEGGGG